MVAFVLFVIMVLSVGLWLDGVIPALREYIQMILEDTRDGGNSYEKASAFSMINIGFVKFNIVNVLMKLIVIVVYCLALWQIKRRLGHEEFFPLRLESAEWGLLSIMTMLVSYHRVYDGVMFMPFLGIIFLEEYRDCFIKSKVSCLKALVKISSLFALLLFWAIPQSVVFSLESWLGRHFTMGEKIFYYMNFEHYTKMFPLMNFVVIMMFCLFFWIFWKRTVKQGKETD